MGERGCSRAMYGTPSRSLAEAATGLGAASNVCSRVMATRVSGGTGMLIAAGEVAAGWGLPRQTLPTSDGRRGVARIESKHQPEAKWTSASQAVGEVRAGRLFCQRLPMAGMRVAAANVEHCKETEWYNNNNKKTSSHNLEMM